MLAQVNPELDWMCRGLLERVDVGKCLRPDTGSTSVEGGRGAERFRLYM